eukprot:172259_1
MLCMMACKYNIDTLFPDNNPIVFVRHKSPHSNHICFRFCSYIDVSIFVIDKCTPFFHLNIMRFCFTCQRYFHSFWYYQCTYCSVHNILIVREKRSSLTDSIK